MGHNTFFFFARGFRQPLSIDPIRKRKLVDCWQVGGHERKKDSKEIENTIPYASTNCPSEPRKSQKKAWDAR